MDLYVTDKYDRRALVVRPGTRGGAPAIVRYADGTELELHYEDLRGSCGFAFYGLSRDRPSGRKLSDIRADFQSWRDVDPSTLKTKQSPEKP
jgi:hypothetical protein